MKFISFNFKNLIFFLVAFTCGISYAQKSADECRAESKAVPESQFQKAVIKCLLDAANAAPTPANIERKKRTEENKSKTFVIQEFKISEINSANGVEVEGWFNNPNPESDIKYVTISASIYNAVGDRVASSIGGKTTAVFRYTGPLKHGAFPDPVNWEPAWYNATAKCILISSVKVEFMDGKSKNYSGSTLPNALGPDVNLNCKPT